MNRSRSELHYGGQFFFESILVVPVPGAEGFVAPYGVVDWVKNARVSGQVHLRKHDLDAEYSIHELSPGDAAIILKRYLQRYPLTASYFDARLESPMSAFVEDAKTRPVFELRKIMAQELKS